MNAKTEFTQMLYELVRKQNLSLTDSLEIISKFKGNGCVGKAASYVLDCLKNGIVFSSALKTCNHIEFDNIYITFVSYAEKTGNFGETCEYLFKRCKRKEENMFQVIEACAYPIFVVSVAILGVLFLLGFGKNSLFLSMFSGNFYDSLIRSYSFGFVFLVLFFSISFLVLKNILGDNKMFESFLAADFLVRSGINFVDAMDALISVAGIDSKLGVIFQNAKIRMMDGLDLTVAFDGIDSKLEKFLYLASKSGGECEVFGKIANYLENLDEKKRKFCFLLIEPIFICGTGIFLMILLVGTFFPMVESMNVF